MAHEQKGAGEARDYVAYLLRMWREKGGAPCRWRAALQDPHSGKRVGFASIEELFGYLRTEMDDLPERDKGGPGNEGQGA